MENKIDRPYCRKMDLKPGYLVEFRGDMDLGLVCTTESAQPYIALENRGIFLDAYHDDLLIKSPYAHDLDIMRIYGKPHDPTSVSGLTYAGFRDILWERVERKKMTVEEIEEALGYKVEIVGSDNCPTSFCSKCTGCAGCQECKDDGTYDDCCCDHKDDCPKKGECE